MSDTPNATATPVESKELTSFADLVSLCKRRGFIFPSSEIYGGIGSCWDYGPLGVELKLNLKNAWWKEMTDRDDVEGVDASILMHPRVWEASGHVEGFVDPLIDCKNCKSRFRADKIDPAMLKKNQCPECEKFGTLTEPRQFNLMFKTHMGPLEDTSALVYLRPETAQGIFVNFENVQQTARQKIPFGIAQIGKAFRNEITPGNFIFRTREFEQMEMQYFVKPGTDMEHFEQWKAQRVQWHYDLGLRKNKLRFHEHGPGELAHYARAAFDIEYEFPIGWQEIEGIHNRGDFDLRRHQEFSSKKLEYFDEAAKEKYLPYVVETSVGCDRVLLATLCDAYRLEGDRTVLKIHPKLAPYKVAVFPLMKKPELMEMTDKIYGNLKKHFRASYDESGAIGKRYRRHDEIGTPFCVTVDYDGLTDNTVTIRERDGMTQERINADKLVSYIHEKIGSGSRSDRVMKSWLRNALLILTLVTGTGAIARAQVQEGETPPQNRMFYVRALAGVGYYYRFEGVSEYGFGFSYGGEAGFGLIHVRSGEFDTVGLGVHLDRFSLNTEQVETRQTFVLGQVTFMKSSDIGAYFGPEAGVRQVNNNGVDMGSGFVAGLFGGVEIPLTTHLTYGPQLEVLYAFDVPFQLNSISGFESNLIGRVFLAVTYHL